MSPRLTLALLLTAAASLPLHAPLLAQTHKIATPDRVTRAVGVFEYTGDIAKPTAARFIPVSIFIDARLQDAGAYLARPVPLAVQSGSLYTVTRAGLPLGTLDIDTASRISTRHSADDNPISSWLGFGRFTPPPTQAELDAKAAKLKSSSKISTITGATETSSDDDTPHFVYRKPDSTPDPAPPDPTTATKPKPSTSDADPDRPTLRHRDPSAEQARARQKKEKPADYVTGPADSLNDDPDRPSLRRGNAADSTQTPPLAGLPANMHQAVAVSDPDHTEDHPFARPWDSPSERLAILTTLQDLGRPRILQYLSRNHLQPAPAPPPSNSTDLSSPPDAATPSTPDTGTEAPPTLRRTPNGVPQNSPAAAPPAPTPSRPTSSSRKAPSRAPQAAPKTTEIALVAEQLSSYSLSYGGLPTFVYTVQVPVNTGGPIYLTLVSQRIPSGELQISLSSITDATHLDRTPWLRPIDVIDADGSHRASILFELRAQTSRQFALYRLITAQAEQTFTTGLLE